MLDYYVYAWLRRDGTPYYIGKGVKDRAWRKHKNIGRPDDKSRIIIVERNLTEVGAFAIERRLISWYGRKIDNSGVLRNTNPGGEGARLPGALNGMYKKSHTAKTKALQSSCKKGKSWEEIYGTEGAQKKRTAVTGKPKLQPNYRFTNHRNYDPTEYTFFNYRSGVIVKCTQTVFRKNYNLNLWDIMHNGWTSHGWGLIYQ